MENNKKMSNTDNYLKISKSGKYFNLNPDYINFKTKTEDCNGILKSVVSLLSTHGLVFKRYNNSNVYKFKDYISLKIVVFDDKIQLFLSQNKKDPTRFTRRNSKENVRKFLICKFVNEKVDNCPNIKIENLVESTLSLESSYSNNKLVSDYEREKGEKIDMIKENTNWRYGKDYLFYHKKNTIDGDKYDLKFGDLNETQVKLIYNLAKTIID